MTRAIEFEVETVDRSSGARAGVLRLARGVIETPVFMPVGTQGALRSLPPLFLDEIGSQIILANTYHLHQRPGERVVAKLGGLHRFMGVELPILTDSGGFQVFSLAKKEVEEKGVTFAYEVDGKATFLSPERSMAIQQELGSDIAMAFDECLRADADREEVAPSVDRTARWAARSLAAHESPDQSLFGIVQGGMFPDLRRRSVEQITSQAFDGFAIGGLSVGEGPETMYAMLDETTPLMPAGKPRYLMGVGRPQDLMEGVARGVDMFDCVIPTRHARSGMLYTFRGRLRVSQARYRRDGYPPDTACTCYTCRSFSRGYLNHLLAVGEVLGTTLCTIHNLTFFRQLMERARAGIADGSFASLRAEIRQVYPETSGHPVGLPALAEEPTRAPAGRGGAAGRSKAAVGRREAGGGGQGGGERPGKPKKGGRAGAGGPNARRGRGNRGARKR